jgi:hypothetical protein
VYLLQLCSNSVCYNETGHVAWPCQSINGATCPCDSTHVHVPCTKGLHVSVFIYNPNFVSLENNEDDFHQNINDEGIVFTKLLSVIAEKLGSSCFPELQHFLLNLKCPDGSAFIKSDYLYHHKTVNGLLSSLVTANLCTARDVDVLIHTLSGLKRGDLLTLISAYVPQITVGNPRSALPMREGSVVLKLSLPDALKKIDLGMVSAIKLDLCTICNLKEQPFLLQYIGWKTSPVTLFFQFRIACMMLVEKGLQSDSLHKLSENGIHCITICFNNTFVYYPF